MRKLLVTAGVTLLLSASALPAFAETQPSNGVSSTGRNDAGFGGGPHCHVLRVNSNQQVFDEIAVYPSHTAHAAQLANGSTVFAADPNCDGDAGQ